jgi:hypothetical protein
MDCNAGNWTGDSTLTVLRDVHGPGPDRAKLANGSNRNNRIKAHNFKHSYLQNTTLCSSRHCRQQLYVGHVTSYDAVHQYYKVSYEDGDCEEMTLDELPGVLVPMSS